MIRFLPRSLFGRLMLVLASGLVIAQLLSAAVNLAERDSALLRASGMQPAQRIADIVRLLDSLGPAERARVADILQVPPLIVSLDRAPLPIGESQVIEPHATIFSTVLRAALGEDRAVRVAVDPTPPGWRGPGLGPGRGPGPGAMMGRMAGAHGHPGPPGGMAMVTQVQLNDGSWATFDVRLPQQSLGLPWKLLLTLALLLGTVLLLSYVAVRFVTRPLAVLATAADDLGRDIHRPPLPEDGPTELGRAARAFNGMQSKLVRLIEDRTRLLTAMSHDLKTPITRMRLRAELLDDEEVRAKFESDLLDMERMVTDTLEFMRGLSAREPARPVDVMSLLEAMQADYADMGQTVTVAGSVTAPLAGSPALLKRCLSNLIDNAIRYGSRADVSVLQTPDAFIIRIRDAGPGIPEADLAAVFEPFVRLESSRNRQTGGTGLGLGIARNIARAYGGDVELRNAPSGGLEAILTLPMRGPVDAPGGGAPA